MSNSRDLAIWGGPEATQMKDAIDIGNTVFKAIICEKESNCIYNPTMLPIVPISEKTKEKYFLIIPNRGTKSIESLLEEKYGMRNTIDFYTLWLEQ